VNSWTQRVDEVDPLEMLECSWPTRRAVPPDLTAARVDAVQRLAASLRGERQCHEGVFGRGYKGPGHPHTNMAKAAVNMLTRTSAREMFETDRILMTSVDTG